MIPGRVPLPGILHCESGFLPSSEEVLLVALLIVVLIMTMTMAMSMSRSSSLLYILQRPQSPLRLASLLSLCSRR